MAEALRMAEALVVAARGCASAAAFPAGLNDLDRANCAALARKISILVLFFEEIKASVAVQIDRDALPASRLADLLVSVEVSRRFLRTGCLHDGDHADDPAILESLAAAGRTVGEQVQYVSWQLEKAIGDFNYGDFDVPEEVVEQAELVRAQLRRVADRAGPDALETFPCIYNAVNRRELNRMSCPWRAGAVPKDLLCPISLDLMRDPVVVSTGQTYERSSIQKWLDSGKVTCPKTRQKLDSLELTPNQTLRRLIARWRGPAPEGSDLVRRLASPSPAEQRAAAAEARALARRSGAHRVEMATAGAIPALVRLLSSPDPGTVEHAVTALLNLSISRSNRREIVAAGAVAPTVEVLRRGSAEARGNAAFALFSLSLEEENQAVIGAAEGVFEALVALLGEGSPAGRRDAATALYSLCAYHGNKARAARAGAMAAAVGLIEDKGGAMVQEGLALVAAVAPGGRDGVPEAVRALVGVLRTHGAGQDQLKENAAAVLLALCRRDAERLRSLTRLGAAEPLAELAESGTDRARRKAGALLDRLNKLRGLVSPRPLPGEISRELHGL
ncbi:U-box domain-containing protein 11-like [Wolffia australiana]